MVCPHNVRPTWSAFTILALLMPVTLPAADQKTRPPSSGQSAKRETIAKPLTAKQQRQREDSFRKEAQSAYRRWMTEDVAYIITDEEKEAWKRLGADEEREQFVEQFWLQRDPTADTLENEFKEEHYRRIAYANERFASGLPGWKTDRGRIYIMYGPPDENDSHTSGGQYQRPIEEGGGLTSTYPFEKWRYRHIEGIGSDIEIEFVDPTMSGEFRMAKDPSEKDALLMVPNAGLTTYEELGLSTKADRFNRPDRLGIPQGSESRKMSLFERQQQLAKLQTPPKVKFKDLEAAVNASIRYNILPLQLRADYFPLTESSTLVNVTMQVENKDLQFQAKDGVENSTVEVHLRITGITGRRIALSEEALTVQRGSAASLYWKSFALAPGRYRLDLVAKDLVAGSMSTQQMVLEVPGNVPEKLAHSSLILADIMEKVPPKNIGTGMFVIGSTKVRPRLNHTFQQNEKMGIYLKAYNLGAGERQKPQGAVSYVITPNGVDESVFTFTEAIASIPDASTSQVTIERLLPLRMLRPGQYTLAVTVTDVIRKEALVQRVNFTVNPGN